MSRVLIVDGEPVILMLLEELLGETEGRVVHAVASLAEARALLEELPFDVALVEHRLSDGSGLELLRDEACRASIGEAMVMSAFPSSNAVLEALHVGAVEYLAKPFEEIRDVALRVANAEERVRLRRERRELHEALRESEERYRKLFAASPDAIVVYDEVTRVIRDANDAAEAMFAAPRDELVGRGIDELRQRDEVPPGDGPASPERFFVPAKDQERLDVEITAGRYGADGQRMVVELIRDVTARRSAERARRELQEQLRHAQKLEAVGMLAGGVAHDFNNMLAVITTYASLMVSAFEQGDLDAVTMREDAEQILHAAQSAAVVTRQLLAFSRREVTTPETLEPAAVVSGIERILQRTVGEEIELVTELDEAAGHAHIDRGQLEQVMVNLVLNARDAMPGGGQVRIGVAREGACLVLEVSDDGAGMSDDVLRRLFEPFFTTKPRGKGTGLGLATVKGIVEAAQGTIEVTSALGIGSTFRIRLPAVAAPEVRSIQPARGTAGARAGECILLAEDDDGVRGATRRLLKRAGYEVIEARHGVEALERLREHAGSVDLLLTDVVMPELGGDALAERVVADNPEMAVVFITGYAAGAFRQSADGARRVVLPKPFREERLLEVLREVLDQRSAPPASQRRLAHPGEGVATGSHG